MNEAPRTFETADTNNPLHAWKELRDDAVSREGVAKALKKIDSDYGHGAELGDRLAYHNVPHTKNVLRRMHEILQIVDQAHQTAGQQGLSQHDYRKGALAAGFHDYDLSTTIEEKGSEIRQKQKTGENERISADGLEEYVIGVENFSPEDIAEMRRAILATEPTFENGNVYQPKIMGEKSIVVLALAFADLGAAGMDDFDAFSADSDSFFLEQNPDVAEAILGTQKEPLSPDLEEKYKQRILTAARSQISFAECMKQRFAKEVELFPEAAREPLIQRFYQFDSNINAARDEVRQRELLSFAGLANSLRPRLDSIT